MHPYPETRFDARHPRQEPSAVVPHAGVCAGAAREGGPYRSRRSRHAPRDSSSFYDMATTVLRIRLIGGDRMDITYDEPDVSDEDQLAERLISTLAEDSGMLRSKHGDRLVVVYGRGVAAIEVAPRGAVL